MENSLVERIYQMLDSIPVTSENVGLIEEIKNDISEENLTDALEKINRLSATRNRDENEQMIDDIKMKILKKKENILKN